MTHHSRKPELHARSSENAASEARPGPHVRRAEQLTISSLAMAEQAFDDVEVVLDLAAHAKVLESKGQGET